MEQSIVLATTGQPREWSEKGEKSALVNDFDAGGHIGVACDVDDDEGKTT